MTAHAGYPCLGPVEPPDWARPGIGIPSQGTPHPASSVGEQITASASLFISPSRHSCLGYRKSRPLISTFPSSVNCHRAETGSAFPGIQTGYGLRSRYLVTFDQKHAAVRA